MELLLDKKILDPYIDKLIYRLKFLYGISYAKELESRLSKINHLYISDELDKTNAMYFDRSTKDIYINDFYVPKDYNGNKIIDYNNTDDFFKNALIHELLHAASSRKDAEGVMQFPKGVHKTSINEGITQMLADDITGFYQNKFLGGYNFQKIVANILRISLGNDVLLDSYFMDCNILEKKLNDISPLKNINSYLFIGLFHYSENKDENRDRRINNILKLLVLNVVVPTYNSLENEKYKQNYLSSLIYAISEDEVIKAKLIGYINECISLDKNQTQKENYKALDEFGEIYYSQDAMDDFPNMNKLVIKDDGTVLILGRPGETIKSREQLEKIYTKLFELNGYKKYLTKEVVDDYIESIRRGKTLKININSVLKRRIVFCGLKECLDEKGYLVLNDFEELDKTNNIKIKYINKSITFDDYRKMCENFSICKNVVGKKEYTYSVVYNSTKNEVEDDILRRFAFFAINFMNCVQDNGLEGIKEAFNIKNLIRYNDIMNSFYKVFENKNTFIVDDIARVSKNPNLIRKMMATPIQAEWVLDYIGMMFDGPIKARKSKSVAEINNPDYLFDKSIEEAEEIVRKNR